DSLDSRGPFARMDGPVVGSDGALRYAYPVLEDVANRPARSSRSWLRELPGRQAPWSNPAMEIRQLLHILRVVLPILFGCLDVPAGSEAQWLARWACRPCHESESCHAGGLGAATCNGVEDRLGPRHRLWRRVDGAESRGIGM